MRALPMSWNMPNRNARIYIDPPRSTSVALARSGGEGHIGRLLSVENSGKPNDPMFADQWGLANTGQREGRAGGDISALKAWERTKGDKDTVVAVLDSGVEYTHEDLAANMWVRPDSIPEYADAELGVIDDRYGYDADENDGDPMDENGHGTHCAGIVGAVGDNGVGIAGVNWHVQIMPLKFMGRGGFGTTKDAIEAINYVVERKKAGVPVSIISASWGSTLYSRALEDAIRKAGEAGILFIAAAGNSSTNTDRSPHYPAGYNLPNILSVAALNRRDDLASFSNYGAKTVHVAAPGAEIVSTWLAGSYFEASGTSMATPAGRGCLRPRARRQSELHCQRIAHTDYRICRPD
jgi:subtilisin family serine protease